MIICFFLAACSNFEYRRFAEMDNNEKKKLTSIANESCAKSSNKKECINAYINSRDNNITAKRMSDTLWNEMNYEEKQWVSASIQKKCLGQAYLQNCLISNLQARDAYIVKRRQEKAAFAATLAKINQETSSMAQTIIMSSGSNNRSTSCYRRFDGMITCY